MKMTMMLAFALLATPAWANDVQHGSITIKEPWARETIASGKAGGSYMMIINAGEHTDRLIGASSPVAAKVELHTHIKDGEVMRMREVEGGIEVPAGETTMLAPGGFHVMMMGLNGPLQEGASFPLTLTFENAGEVGIEVDIKDISHGAGQPMHHHKK